MSRPFHFKHFSVIQEQSAMKVGFDGVILGAWSSIKTSSNALDIGTGTGLIALMLAQRNRQAKIIAIEQDALACEEAKFNFNQSEFNKQICVVHANFFHWESKYIFDAIVCNPPFFTENICAQNENRSKARQATHFPLHQWLGKAKELLNSNGTISFIYPSKEIKHIEDTLAQHQLFIHRQCWLKSNPNKEAHRILLEVRQTKSVEIETSELSIHQDTNGKYHEQFVKLCQDFYLNL